MPACVLSSGGETEPGRFEQQEFVYQNGIVDYVKELAGENALTTVQHAKTEKRGRDRADKPEYKVKVEAAFCFSNAGSPAGILPQLVLAGARRRAG